MLLLLFVACAHKATDPSTSTDTATDTADTATDTADTATGAEACGWASMPDLDPDPQRVEVTLEAAPLAWDPGTGTPLTGGLAFNGSVPGPALEANLGDTVTVHFTNHTDAPLTLHWHGLRVPVEMDGVSQMMDPVAPGESFDYTFTLQDAGFYWFHPHMDTAGTIEAGLYAPLIVHAPGERAPDCDLPLALDDVLLDDDQQIAPPGSAMSQLMGRLGSVLLANGRSDRSIAVAQGQTILLRLVNASNARYWDLALEGHTFEVVGTDGGFLASPYTAERLTLAPGERVMAVVEAVGEPGQAYRLMNRRVQLHEEGGHMAEEDPLGDGENPVLTLQYAAAPVAGTPWVQPTPDVPPWTEAPALLGHRWVLSEDMARGTVAIDGASWPDVPMVMAARDTPTTFEVENTSEMHHPFHIHGNRFQVLAVDGLPVAGPPAWKDTVDIPPGAVVTLASALDNPGEWMYHCHILEHADGGMAGMMLVE